MDFFKSIISHFCSYEAPSARLSPGRKIRADRCRIARWIWAIRGRTFRRPILLYYKSTCQMVRALSRAPTPLVRKYTMLLVKSCLSQRAMASEWLSCKSCVRHKAPAFSFAKSIEPKLFQECEVSLCELANKTIIWNRFWEREQKEWKACG